MFSYVSQSGRLREADAQWFFQQLILGIDYCHRKGIVNRDIKLENLLLMSIPNQRPCIKLCDFGYSKLDQVGESSHESSLSLSLSSHSSKSFTVSYP